MPIPEKRTAAPAEDRAADKYPLKGTKDDLQHRRAADCRRDSLSVQPSAVTQAFPRWRAGSGWHHRQAGYYGHLVQVTDDFGELVAVGGRLQYPRSITGGDEL